MRRYGRYLAIALVVGAALPLIGCPLVVLKLAVQNCTDSLGLTGLTMTTVNVSKTSSSSWGSNMLSANVAPGSTGCIKGIQPGTYDIRVVFDNKDAAGGTSVWTTDSVNGSNPALGPVNFKSSNLALKFYWNGTAVYVEVPAEWYLK